MVAIHRSSFLFPFLTFLSFVFCFLFFSPVHAQSDSAPATVDPNAAIAITMNPKNPAPGDTVRLSVTGGPLVDLQDSTITWSQNGKTVSKGVGKTSVDMRVGSLGQETGVVVQVTAPDGTGSSLSLSIIPTHIDLLVDADSYTPPFYRGRALPSAGTRLHAQALAYFKRADGSSIPPSSIVYTWRQNDQVVGQVSGKGRQAVTLNSPVLFGTDIISVDAVSVDGSLRGSATMRLSSVAPVLALYEDHPLFGILYHQMMGGKTSIPDSEMTFAAVPYFAQAQSPADPRLLYAWTVNRSDVPINTAHPDKIIINADKSKGEATIELSLSHTTNFFMSHRGAWDVLFRTTRQANNPFSNSF